MLLIMLVGDDEDRSNFNYIIKYIIATYMCNNSGGREVYIGMVLCKNYIYDIYAEQDKTTRRGVVYP